MNSNKPRKILFAHSGPLRVDPQGNYYGVGISDELRKRYLLLGDQVSFVIRVKKISTQEARGFSKISHDRFSVIEAPDYLTLRRVFLKKQAKKIIEQSVTKADIVVARIPSGFGNLAAKYAIKHKKPLMAEVVACPFDALWNHSFKGKLLAHRGYFRLKKLVKKIDYLVYVTSEFLQRRYPSPGKQTNISNVEIKAIDENSLAKRLQKIGKNHGAKILILGTIGAVNVKYKGHHYVFKAIKKLKKAGKIFHYRIAGEGDNSRLKKLAEKYGIEDQVEFSGPIPHKKVFEWLDEIDLYVHPSNQEGLPRALIEAMSRACPAIGSTTGGIPELLLPEAIFERKKSNELIHKLRNVDTDFLYKMALHNFQEAKNYQRDVLNERREDFYKLFLLENNLLK